MNFADRPESEQKWWETTFKLDRKASDPGVTPEEAASFPAQVESRFAAKGLTRRDYPSHIKRRCKVNGIALGRLANGKEKRTLTRRGSHRAKTWPERLTFAVRALGGSGTTRQIFEKVKQNYRFTSKDEYALVRSEIQNCCSESSKWQKYPHLRQEDVLRIDKSQRPWKYVLRSPTNTSPVAENVQIVQSLVA